MYGFRIKHNFKNFVISLADEGAVGINVDNKWNGTFYLNVGGCDKQGRSHQWHSEKLQLGDEIEIIFEDVCENEISPARIFDFADPECRKAKMIEAYIKLKQELIDDGVL